MLHCVTSRLDIVDRDAGGVPLDEIGVTGLLDQVGDAVQRPVQRLLLPVVTERRAILDSGQPVRVSDELERVGALGAQPAVADRAAPVALDVDDLFVLGVDELAAADRAVRANAVGHGGAAQPSVNGCAARAQRLFEFHVSIE